MNQAGARESPTHFLESLRDHWPMLLLIVSMALVGAAAYLLLATERYRAEADVLVLPVPPDDPTFVGIPLIRESNESRGVLTAARLIKSPEVAQGVEDQLGLDRSWNELLSQITVTPQEQSNVLIVTAEAESAKRAAQTANAFAEVTIAQRSAEFQRELNNVVQRLSARLAEIPAAQQSAAEAQALSQRLGELRTLVGAPDPTLRISSRAVAPAEPSSPRPLLTIAVAIAASVLLGIAAIVLLDSLSPRIRRVHELEELGLPVLTSIPAVRRSVIERILQGRQERTPAIRNAHRALRADIADAVGKRGKRTLFVTSSGPDQGKTMAAANLALAAAGGGTHTILVDADLARPALGRLFTGASRGLGLDSLLSDEAHPTNALTEVEGDERHLRLLLQEPDDGRFLDLGFAELVRAVDKVQAPGELVVLDGPTLTEAPDAVELAKAADAVFVAVTLSVTRRAELHELSRLLLKQGLIPAGFIVTPRHLCHDRPRERPDVRRWLSGLAARRPSRESKPDAAY